MKHLKKSSIYVIWAICLCITMSGCAEVYPMDEPEREIENLDNTQDFVSDNDSLTAQDDDTSQSEQGALEETDSIAESDEAPSDNNDVQSEESAREQISADMSELVKYDEDSINQAAAGNVGRYAYETLSQDKKRIYNQMYLSLMDMKGNIQVDTMEPEELKDIFQKLMADHPEIFWVIGYSYTNYQINDVLQAVGFTGNYNCDMDTRNTKQAKIDSYVNTCLSGVPGGDDYSKIKYIYEYLIGHTEYDAGASDNQNICSVFLNGRSVCQGYAKATQYLLGKLGIKCIMVTGHTNTGENHAWNIVYADGSYYQLDTTWGDASYKDNGSGAVTSSINYDYLCVTSSDIYKTHTPDGSYDLPNCSSMADNYYVREGAYFTTVDGGQLSNLFSGAIAQGKSFVTMKASDSNVYSSLKQYLVSEQHIFEYLGSSNSSVSYWESPDSNSISFRL